MHGAFFLIDAAITESASAHARPYTHMYPCSFTQCCATCYCWFTVHCAKHHQHTAESRVLKMYETNASSLVMEYTINLSTAEPTKFQHKN